MGGIGKGYTTEESSVLAVQSGADVLLKPTDPTKAVNALVAAVESGRPCVIDFRVDHEEKVYPMIPAGGGSDDIVDQEWVDDDNLWVGDGV